MKKWQLGWQMMTPVQKTVFVMLIVCAGSVLLLPESPYLIRMAGLGAVGAWVVVRPRRYRSLRPGSVAWGNPPRPQRKAPPKDLTEVQRAVALRTAGWNTGCRIAEGKTDRAGALKQMAETMPGLPPERYETALDEAQARIEGYRAEARARRTQRVAEARALDALNAVFALHYYNRRYSRHVGEYGLGEINLWEALGDLFSRKQIDEAVRRSDALIEEGLRVGIGSRDHEPKMARLRAAHAGFDDRALNDALAWGRVIHR